MVVRTRIPLSPMNPPAALLGARVWRVSADERLEGDRGGEV